MKIEINRLLNMYNNNNNNNNNNNTKVLNALRLTSVDVFYVL